jgi:hypothetical protein
MIEVLIYIAVLRNRLGIAPMMLKSSIVSRLSKAAALLE